MTKHFYIHVYVNDFNFDKSQFFCPGVHMHSLHKGEHVELGTPQGTLM